VICERIQHDIRAATNRDDAPNKDAGAWVWIKKPDPQRDVQEAASHADPRTIMRYDRARTSLDQHATYIVAAYVGGAAR
jgi:hypothetical protein